MSITTSALKSIISAINRSQRKQLSANNKTKLPLIASEGALLSVLTYYWVTPLVPVFPPVPPELPLSLPVLFPLFPPVLPGLLPLLPSPPVVVPG